MKKSLFVAAIAAIALVACKKTENVDAAATDSLAVDTLTVVTDSVSVAGDSATVVTDSATVAVEAPAAQ